MTHLYKIKDKQGRIVTFQPNYIQLLHAAERQDHRYNYILKARQFGFTTFYCIDLLDEALWNTGMACALIAHERDALIKIFNIVKRAYVNLPEGLKPVTKTDTKNAYEFVKRFDNVPLDSTIYVALKIRSGTVQNLHITESAYIKDRQELDAGSKQTVPIHGRISEETTGNGLNEFYDAFMDARKKKIVGPMDYKSYFYPWYLNTEYSLNGQVLTAEDMTKSEKDLIRLHPEITNGQLLWRRWKMNELKQNNKGFGLTGEQLFKQEYPSTVLEAFQSGAGSVFDLEKLESLEPTPPKTLSQLELEILDAYKLEGQEHIRDFHLTTVRDLLRRGVQIWELPKIGTEYVSGCDPSDGQGSDFGVIDVWTRPKELERNRQVAQFYGKLLPDDLAELVKDLSSYYNRAFAGVENNMLTTISHLVKIYDNYFSKVTIDEKTQLRSKKIGWNTNGKSRELMIDEFLIDFENDELEIRSEITLAEMRTFVKKSMAEGRYKREHANGKHDDALFGAMIANQMSKYKRPTAKAYGEKPAGM